MVDNRIRAATAAYLDTSHARALDVPQEAQRKIVQRFITCCYDDLAKEPRHLEGDDVERALCAYLPRYFGARDPLALSTEEVLNAYFRHLREDAVVLHAYEIGVAFDAHIETFCATVRAGKVHEEGIAKTRVLHDERRGTKVGRNDPCPCGSGQKFKKCCMKLGD